MDNATDAGNTGLARLRSGDLSGLTELVLLHQQRLYRYLVRVVGDPAAAEDLFQETWIRVAGNIRRYDPDRSFEHWLFAVAHNLAIDYLRKRRPQAFNETSMERHPVHAGALDRLLERERTSMMSGAIAGLPAPYREVLTLRFSEDLKLDEIAAITGSPLPTIKTRLRRALQCLRERLQS